MKKVKVFVVTISYSDGSHISQKVFGKEHEAREYFEEQVHETEENYKLLYGCCDSCQLSEGWVAIDSSIDRTDIVLWEHTVKLDV